PTAKPAETKVTIAKGTSTPGCEAKKGCYKPFEAKVKTGSKVTWTNSDTAVHTVTSGKDATADGTFDSSMIPAGKTFSYTFSKAGKYDYYCLVHPWMTGKVTVS
ncbi:MAG: cupredoxin domain-containing protein, partial [Nitrosopumilaceae archaeon]